MARTFMQSSNSKSPEEEEMEIRELEEENRKQAQETQEEETHPRETEDLSAEEKSWKKRYGDLRTLTNSKDSELKELKDKVDQLTNRIDEGPRDILPPAKDEDIDAWQAKYPEVASIINTIATRKAEEKFSRHENDIKTLQEDRASVKRERDLAAIKEAHPDFDGIQADDSFHDWVDEQAQWVKKGLFENGDDPASVISILDLYKAKNGGEAKAASKKAKEAVTRVNAKTKSEPSSSGTGKSFSESQVEAMSIQDYEKNEDAILEAQRSGNFNYDISGGVR